MAKHFKILKNDNQDLFEKQAKTLLESNWKLHGDLIVVAHDKFTVVYIQAFVSDFQPGDDDKTSVL